MSMIKKCILACILLFGLCLASTLKISDKNLQKQIESVIFDTKQTYGMNAIEVSVLSLADDSMLNLASGYITAQEHSQLIHESNIFQVASITKTFTAYIILTLVDQGKLKVTDKLGKFLPQYPQFSNLTILQLLNNTSGVFDYVDSKNWWENLFIHQTNWTETELLQKAVQGNSYFVPGSGWHYSNTNYVLLGMIIEKVSGKNLCQIEQKLIFDRYHLHNTYCAADGIPESTKSKLVHGYRNNVIEQTNINPSWLQAAGDLLSNSHDVVRWYAQYAPLINSNKAYRQQFVNIVNGSQLYPKTSTTYGFGVFSMPTPYGELIFTPGLAPGYMGLVGYLPCRKIVFSYLVSSTYTKHGLHTYILSRLLPVLAISFANEKNKECNSYPVVKSIQFPNF